MFCQYCGNQVQSGAVMCPYCGANVQAAPNGVQPAFVQTPLQQIGEDFQLMPGERMICQGSMQQIVFPAISTYMRLTDQRLVFCDISRWLTIGLSFWFSFTTPTKISHSFTREDIASMELRPGFGRKKIVITDRYGKNFQYVSQWFSDALVQNAMAWWNGWR